MKESKTAKPVIVSISERACSIAFGLLSTERITLRLLAKIRDARTDESRGKEHAVRHLTLTPAEARELRNYFRGATDLFSTQGDQRKVEICVDAIDRFSQALATGESKA